MFIALGMLLSSLISIENVDAQTTTVQWKTQVVDSRGTAGTLIVDSQNNPHIFYHENTVDDIDYQPQGLYYSILTDQEWSIQNLKEVAGNIFIMDQNNKPHIVSIENGHLDDTTLLGSNWNLNQFGVESIAGETMKLDSNGNMHTLTKEQKSYPENNSREDYLYYHNWTKTSDSSTLIAKTSASGANFDYLIPLTLVVDSQNNPHLIFIEEVEAGVPNSDGGYSYPTTSRSIESAKYDGSQWLFETIAKNVSESANDVSDLVLDSKGYPHLCCVKYTNQRSIDHIYFNGESWVSQTIDADDYNYYSFPTLRIDGNGNPQVYYYQDNYAAQNKNGLMVAKWTGAQWDIKNLGTVPFDSSGEYHEQTTIDSIEFDSYGNLYVLYSEVVGTYRGAPRYGDLTVAYLNTNTIIQPLILLLVAALVAIVILLFVLIFRRYRKTANPKQRPFPTTMLPQPMLLLTALLAEQRFSGKISGEDVQVPPPATTNLRKSPLNSCPAIR
ncbi:MAG: hypothetical protein NWE93_14820 [Candidatus Bathyarchaeota archaeon]|nr:hypothetical protein [Candidatus Bathyarchaeota archaeon]